MSSAPISMLCYASSSMFRPVRRCSFCSELFQLSVYPHDWLSCSLHTLPCCGTTCCPVDLLVTSDFWLANRLGTATYLHEITDIKICKLSYSIMQAIIQYKCISETSYRTYPTVQCPYTAKSHDKPPRQGEVK